MEQKAKVGYIHIEIPAEEKKALRIRCSYEDKTISEVMRQLIREYMKTPTATASAAKVDIEILPPVQPKRENDSW